MLASGSATSRNDPLPAALYLDAQLGLVDDMLHYFDRASMAHSLEVRVPFLDHQLVEYCATIPRVATRCGGCDTKHVLKRAARGLVPDRIIDKPKIGFFHAAVDAWFQRPDARRDQRLPARPEPALRRDPRPRRGRAARARPRAGADRATRRVLLSVLMLEVWLRRICRARSPRAAPVRESITVR